MPIKADSLGVDLPKASAALVSSARTKRLPAQSPASAQKAPSPRKIRRAGRRLTVVKAEREKPVPVRSMRLGNIGEIFQVLLDEGRVFRRSLFRLVLRDRVPVLLVQSAHD